MMMRLKQLVRLPIFLVWFFWQMCRANWEVAVDILTPGSALTPGIVAYRTRSNTSLEVTALSNLITLTPGTLTIDIDEALGSGHTLYVLGLYAPSDPEAFNAQLTYLEDQLLHVMRPGESRSEESKDT